ncbi:hypothetical protein QE152_g4781 [Popillia japonica]|uniref:Uncharacterized protein n=1 Tax=Popillia japonica TaxID=7064 RepID=A0AAW1N0N3_POPJA
MTVIEKEKKEECENVTKSSPQNSLEKKVSRRYSSTSIRSNILKDVPYLRLMDNCVSLLPAKLDSDIF